MEYFSGMVSKSSCEVASPRENGGRQIGFAGLPIGRVKRRGGRSGRPRRSPARTPDPGAVGLGFPPNPRFAGLPFASPSRICQLFDFSFARRPGLIPVPDVVTAPDDLIGVRRRGHDLAHFGRDQSHVFVD